MRLIRKTRQHRRDFTGVYQCESCSTETTASGYDDTHFHTNVIPAMACPSCGATAPANAPVTAADVPAGVVL